MFWIQQQFSRIVGILRFLEINIGPCIRLYSPQRSVLFCAYGWKFSLQDSLVWKCCTFWGGTLWLAYMCCLICRAVPATRKPEWCTSDISYANLPVTLCTPMYAQSCSFVILQKFWWIKSMGGQLEVSRAICERNLLNAEALLWWLYRNWGDKGDRTPAWPATSIRRDQIHDQ